MAGLFGKGFAALLACAWLAPPAAAQVVVNPQVVSFSPSADHDVTDSDGMHLVTWYGLQIHKSGNPRPFLLFNLGKPDRGPDGLIEIQFSTIWQWPPEPGVVLEARVIAVGPGGYGESNPSNPFIFDAVQRPPDGATVPSVKITMPANGSKLAVSRRIALGAVAADASGEVASVSFFVDRKIVGTAFRRPYIVWWTGATVGTHRIIAVAIDNSGAQAASSTVSVNIIPVSPRLAPPGSQKKGTGKPRPPAKPRVPK